MIERFVIADLHLGHKNLYNWEHGRADWGLEADEADEFIVDQWNKHVTGNAKVYVLGDVVFPKRKLELLGRLYGQKVLVGGNHDNYSMSKYSVYFQDIKGIKELDGFILSHIPVHPACLDRYPKGNIHGHLHKNRVQYTGTNLIDRNFICVSVEQLPNYAPIHIDEIESIR